MTEWNKNKNVSNTNTLMIHGFNELYLYYPFLHKLSHIFGLMNISG